MKKDSKIYNILIVEDNLGDFVLIEEYLSEILINSILINCNSFQEAKTILEDSNTFDVIFLDLSLPDLSGEKLIVDMLELADNTPIIALTGFSDLEFSAHSLALGVADYLLKDELTPAILYKSILYNIERNKHIEELHNSEKRYSDLFHFTPSPMIVYDISTLKILSINKAAIEKYGYTHEEFIGMTIKDIRPKEEIPTLLDSLENRWVKNNPDYQRSYRHIKKSGEIIDVEISPAKIKFNNKDVAMVLINDITEKLKYIRTIEEQNKKFKEIAWIQSHIVRAPLARMMGLVNLIENINEDDSENKQMLQFIKDSAEELDMIIRDISKKTESMNHSRDQEF